MPKGISDKFEAPADASGQIIAGNQSLLKRDTEPSGSCSIHFHSSSCIIWHAGAGVPIPSQSLSPSTHPNDLNSSVCQTPSRLRKNFSKSCKKKNKKKFAEIL